MSVLADSLKKAVVAMIVKTDKLNRISVQHFIDQKMGNNPIDTIADSNIYTECNVKNIGSVIICGYGEKNESGLGAGRDIDYSSSVAKMAVAVKDISLVRTNGPYSDITNELGNFLHIWEKYYGSRTSHYRISINDKPANPFTIISAGIMKDDLNLHLEMIIANTKLIEVNAGNFRYLGDLILYVTNNLGFGSTYTKIEKYSENPEDRTILSALTGVHEYGQKFLETVVEVYENMSFIRKELELICPNIAYTKNLLWVSNTFKNGMRNTTSYR
jgi:hypothetical protein